jgi:hypothetical protein
MTGPFVTAKSAHRVRLRGKIRPRRNRVAIKGCWHRVSGAELQELATEASGLERHGRWDMFPTTEAVL